MKRISTDFCFCFNVFPQYFHKIKAQHLPYYSPPTKTVHMTFDEFMSTAHAAEHASLQSDHWYLQLRTKGTSEWIYEDLKEWRPQFNFWFGDPTANQGIDCRFGARGISASNHYDGGRNFIAMLRGKKRYIIAPPTECPNMHLFPQSHPEARHSMGDWANLDYKQYPNYLKVKAINVVLSAGEVLYLPRCPCTCTLSFLCLFVSLYCCESLYMCVSV
eukprot:m.225674 g.225674  ORF g.225674 m.225674 type:complete len:217 (+) comp13860_c0_seq36:1797-2447(+)